MSSVLSESARELLLEASQDPNGTILRVPAMGGQYLKTNRRMLGGPPRERERWLDAIPQLLRLGLIEPHGDHGFSITTKGYRAAAALRNPGS